jgi:cell division protein FtsQ
VAASRKRHPRLRADVLPVPSDRRRLDLLRRAPSGRSLLLGFALLALAGGAYAVARASSLFAVREIDVQGANKRVAADIRRALTPVVGRSLVGLDGARVEREVSALPDVAAVEYDRAFPHSLVVRVRLERPLAVLRQGVEAWLVSARGRVLRAQPRGGRSDLPRIWAPRSVEVSRGGFVDDRRLERGLLALRALAREPLPVRTRSVRTAEGQLALMLASGLELRLGGEADLPLKLAVAARILPTLAPRWEGGPSYLDVSVPERPVANVNPQVES